MILIITRLFSSIVVRSSSLTNCFTTVPASLFFVDKEIFLPFLCVFMLGASVLSSTVPLIPRGAYLPAELYPPLDFQLVCNFVLQSSTSLLLFTMTLLTFLKNFFYFYFSALFQMNQVNGTFSVESLCSCRNLCIGYSGNAYTLVSTYLHSRLVCNI